MTSIAGYSNKRLRSALNSAKAKRNADAAKITSINKSIAVKQKTVDKVDDYFQNVSQYEANKEAYDAKKTLIGQLDKQLKETKSKSKHKKIKSEIKSAKVNAAKAAKAMKTIAASKGYQTEYAKKIRAWAAIKNLKKTKASYATRKASVTKHYGALKKEMEKRKAVAFKKLQKKNSNAIAKKIKANKKVKWSDNVGHTAIYRADLKTSRVFLLAEQQPSETSDSNVAQYPVDNADPRTNYQQRSSRTLTGTYMIFGDSFTKADDQYLILQDWARKGIEVAIKGFSRWTHGYLQSVGKSRDVPYKNAIALTLTFNYAQKAKISYKKKTKGKQDTKKGNSKNTKNTVTIKSGMSLYAIAKHYGVKVSELEKRNPKIGLHPVQGQKVKLS